MLLTVTNSLDGSADVLATLTNRRGIAHFRWNSDLFTEYRFEATAEGFRIEDPAGRIVTSEQITAAYWRKPFINGSGAESFAEAERRWVDSHWRAIVREVGTWCRSAGRLRLVDPEGDRRVGKLRQMWLARDLFQVPDWSVTSGLAPQCFHRVVKTLVPEMIETERLGFVYTTEIPAGANLDSRYPWFTQHMRRCGRDATVVFILGECFAFETVEDRAASGTDWRAHIGTDRQLAWRRIDIPKDVAESCRTFMERSGLHYGRFDFICDDDGWWFLECNPNGQYGWLDDDSAWLHAKVLDAVLSPEATVA
jgi:hypothetical protein